MGIPARDDWEKLVGLMSLPDGQQTALDMVFKLSSQPSDCWLKTAPSHPQKGKKTGPTLGFEASGDEAEPQTAAGRRDGNVASHPPLLGCSRETTRKRAISRAGYF